MFVIYNITYIYIYTVYKYNLVGMRALAKAATGLQLFTIFSRTDSPTAPDMYDMSSLVYNSIHGRTSSLFGRQIFAAGATNAAPEASCSG